MLPQPHLVRGRARIGVRVRVRGGLRVRGGFGVRVRAPAASHHGRRSLLLGDEGGHMVRRPDARREGTPEGAGPGVTRLRVTRPRVTRPGVSRRLRCMRLQPRCRTGLQRGCSLRATWLWLQPVCAVLLCYRALLQLRAQPCAIALCRATALCDGYAYLAMPSTRSLCTACCVGAWPSKKCISLLTSR